MPIEALPFPLGSIVALKTHPYTSLDNQILIGGESQFISPLLVVIEVVKDSQDRFDEPLGFQSQWKGISSKCKCIWYSTKSNQFEEEWLSSKLLKLIPLDEEQYLRKLSIITPNINIDTKNNIYNINIGDLVTLSTSYLEVKKQKFYYSAEQNKETIKPIYSFICPIMQIIGTKKTESKRIKNKPQEIYNHSDLLIKCKWYNPISGKMSEKYIPVEALQKINQLDESKLYKYTQLINEKNIVRATYKGIDIIILPQRIKHSNGYYFILAYDYISNSIKKYDFNKIELSPSTASVIIKRAPNMEIMKSVSGQVEEIFTDNTYKSYYIRIKYKDQINNITFRTVRNFRIEECMVDIKKEKYLFCFCMLRNEIRHFNLERILSAEILDLKFEQYSSSIKA